jgi:hypothetical protein
MVRRGFKQAFSRIARRPLLRVAAYSVPTLASWLSCRDALGCAPLGPVWETPETIFLINANSFATSGMLPGLPLTAEQSRFWIQWAASQWTERTDSAFFNRYIGDTTAHGSNCGGVPDGWNEVDAQFPCREPGCTSLAHHAGYFIGPHFIESDICVYGNSMNPPPPSQTGWTVTSPVAAGRQDFVGTLVHEFGHWLGLAHTNNTVMHPDALSGTMNRYPFGDDIDCVRNLYPSVAFNSNRYWSVMPPSGGFSVPRLVGSGADSHFSANGAVGSSSSGGNFFVVTAVGTDFNSVRFTRAPHPVNPSSPGWTTSFLSPQRTRRPVSIGSVQQGGTGSWAAAWTVEEMFTFNPNGFRIARSPDAFQTVPGIVTLGAGSWALPHEPAIAYDINSGRWVVLFVISNATTHNRIFARTSFDRINWTPHQDLGYATIDAPDVSCGLATHCTLTFAAGGVVDPTAVSAQFNINSATGNITVTSSRQSTYAHVPRTPTVTSARNTIGNAYWFVGVPLPYPNYFGAESVNYYGNHGIVNAINPPMLDPLQTVTPPHVAGNPTLEGYHRGDVVSDPFTIDSVYYISGHY